MSTLKAATASSDRTNPTVSFTSPAAGASLASDSNITVTGTAADVGGVVAGVEVSLDGGQSWHPATGTTQWSYSGVLRGSGAASIRARAIDDSANFDRAGTSLAVTAAGPYTFFGSAVPATASADDSDPVELGLRFTPESDGFVTGVRFFKGGANTGTHVGSLWGPDGTRMGTVTFTNETAMGWQTATFALPITVTAGQTYTVSYTAPKGGYAMQARYWPYAATPASPLSVGTGLGVDAPGVFGAAGARPTGVWFDSNYFVDVVFSSSDTSPLRVLSRTPAADAGSVDPSATIALTLSRAADPATVGLAVADSSGRAAAGNVTYDAASRSIRFSPSTPLAPQTKYTVTPSAKDASGRALESGAAWSFTTRGADLPEGTCPCSLFPESTVPAIASTADPDAVTLGVKVTVGASGTVSGLRYYKGRANTGTHVGILWSATGSELARATFTDDTAEGWQVATFSTPVAVAAGTTVVASYTAPAGGYAVTTGRFASPYARGPLSVPANGAVYTYTGGFPTSPSSTDYGVDLVFQTGPAAPAVVSLSPAAGATGVATDAVVSVSFSTPVKPINGATVTSGGAAVAGSWSLDATATTATFSPTSTLPAGAQIAVSLTGIRSTEGVAGTDVSWSFETRANEAVTRFFSGAVPPQVDADASPVELGLAFQTSTAGEVRAIRFYKATGNGGVHTGSLWGPNGQRLATVTFANETATGWQSATLDSPVTITPGAVYTVSYFAPQGHPSYASGALAGSVTSGPLSTIAGNNGRYRYGNGGVVPTQSWQSSNYFVDVEFVASTNAVQVTSTSPERGAGAVATTVTQVTATLVGATASSAPTLTVAGSSGSVAGTSSFTPSSGLLSFTPSAALPAETSFTATVRLGSSTLDTWQFTTAPAVQTLFGDETPNVAATTDTDPVEVGTAFTVSQPGSVTALGSTRVRPTRAAIAGRCGAPTGPCLRRWPSRVRPRRGGSALNSRHR
ncbi:DUF4082 domain-containing protein [Microbacterium aurum]